MQPKKAKAERMPLVDMDHLPPKQQILYFLKHYGLEKYYKEITTLCDDMDDLRALKQDDFAHTTIKLPHQRKLMQCVREGKLTKVDKDDLVS